MTSVVELDPFSPEIVADPYPFYGQLHQGRAVHWVPSQEMWLVSGYEGVAEVLRDPATFSSAGGTRALFSGRIGRNRTDMQALMGVGDDLRVLIATDPPDHTRLRRLVSRAFTPRTMAELEPRLRALCAGMVDELLAAAGDGDVDLVTGLAVPFPVVVIAELLGIPPERRADFRRWSDATVGVLSGDFDVTGAQIEIAELLTYMAEVVEDRRKHPGDDLVSRVVGGTDESDPDALTFMEVVMFAVLLLIAGNETTTNLVGNAAAAFDAHPEQAELLRKAPELLPAAVEEVLRWDSPVQGFVRSTTRPTRLDGVDLPADAVVLASFAAANRDPSHFADPACFDIERRPTDHFAFGHGIHFCLGAPLARLEARLVGECLLASGASLEAVEGRRRTDSFVLRGFTRFPVRVR